MKKPMHIALRVFLVIWMAMAVSCRAKGTSQVAEFTDQHHTLPSAITLVNWNAYKGRHPEFITDLKALLEKETPDLVFLQEATADLFEPVQMGGYFAGGWSYPWPKGKTIGVLTLSRVAPSRIQAMPSKYREFGVTAPKVSLVTEYPLPDGSGLLAVNVHLLNFERGSVKKISHQLEELKSLMADHSGPIVMAGDFNTWNQKRLKLVEQISTDLKLAEVTTFPNGRRTGDLDSESWNDLFGIDKQLPLDRVFVRGCTPAAARVLDYHSSDHPPILVELTITP